MLHSPARTALALLGCLAGSTTVTAVVQAESVLHLTYPPLQHQTTAERIFLIGTAPPSGTVMVNGRAIARSAAGHFAPSFPLQLGDNTFVLDYNGRDEQRVVVTRVPIAPPLPDGAAFLPDSLVPARTITRLPGETICLEATAAPDAIVRAHLSGLDIALSPQPPAVRLSSNAAVLTATNRPQPIAYQIFASCIRAIAAGPLGIPEFYLELDGEQIARSGPGSIEILEPSALTVVEVTAAAGVARSGPSTTYSRLTPLPRGTRATVTGAEGDWLRLDYGGWIRASETQPLESVVPPQAIVRGLSARQVPGATEVTIPLSLPVPIAIQQDDDTLTLTLFNTVAQTDTIRFDADPLVRRLDWEQRDPTTVQYRFQLRSAQQWGYTARYDGTQLVLQLRHPPQRQSRSLTGVVVLLDPGHGGDELGTRGPTGYPEKAMNLDVSMLLAQALRERGATVYLTRTDDSAVSLGDRAAAIAEQQPTVALSIHYNALPDDGDAIETAGIGAFWYHPQAHDLAAFLHDYLTETLDRPSYGVFWNNLALTRPHAAPTVLLELGFAINPEEFEWIIDPPSQQALARAIADGLVRWFDRVAPQPTEPKR
ncbi:N-acetylmuramoyl-L-alanine amidase [Rubidibacter lacunae KORDI 51-2]|uniref:N-acetylmuramoyl-L-alanine amidase n=1 Tax=Rubidibacter lacunae KORDI 51-2 TaxID=582515 RepID=U5DHV5_9CHRO|nr:N-acetylmuramoyl-L-alanine amidase [Rubidibacter lacunae]ERN40189.1 N-acetylmuramoyl-L-alanine amidase [Rubidibacter lacunae KORDI 51-2]